jgi:enoyl-CoA hydratase/carnithine racemase
MNGYAVAPISRNVMLQLNVQRDNIHQFARMMEIKKPEICCRFSWCLGGGKEHAMSCDMIIASEKPDSASQR